MLKISEAEMGSVEYYALSKIEDVSEVHEEEHIIAMVSTMSNSSFGSVQTQSPSMLSPRIEMGISDLLEWEYERQRLEELLERTKEAYAFLSSRTGPDAPVVPGNSMSPSTQKLKSLEDENSRIKSLLKHQIEASEKLRMDTQMTIETLKEEFDILVKELNQFQKKELVNSAVAQSIQKKISGMSSQNYNQLANAANQLKNLG